MKKLIFLLACSLLFLTSCNNAEGELNDFYDKFTSSLSEEQELQSLNDEYNELESAKASLQEELNNASIEEINNVSGELMDNTTERLALLEEERELMAASNESFEDARAAVEDITDEDYKQEAESLVSAMDNRYDAHETLTDTYVQALESEQSLFEYLMEDDITQDVIDEYLNTIAEYNEPINKATTNFATETEKINQIKIEIEQILENN